MTSTPSSGAPTVDSNLPPPGRIPTRLSVVTIGLILLIIGCLGLAYAIFWLWIESGDTLEDLEERASHADLSVQGTISATTDGAGMKKAEEVRQDFLLVQRRQVSWGNVFHTLLNVPEGLVVDSIHQSGFNLVVDGRASDLSIANEYLIKLQNSGVFKHAQVQLEQITPVSVALRLPDSPTPSPLVEHTASEPSSTPRVPTPAPPTRILATSTPVPRPTETFTITPSFTKTAALEPTFDFALVAQTSKRIEEHGTSHIRAIILDENGNRIRGVAFRIESEGVPAWSAEKSTDDRQDGVVEFAVTKGVFTVRPLVEGRVQAAIGLVTGSSEVPGKQEWELVWRRVPAGDPSPGSPNNTPTITQTPTPTTPPRWAGRNIARLGSAVASRGQDTAHLAIDGNADSIWQSGAFPIQEIVITLNGLYRKSEIEGFELIVAQSAVGKTTHQIWVEDEAGDVHPHTTELTSITRDRQTLIVRWDPRSVGDAEFIKRVFIRTVSGPSWVGWREIMVYEKLPPPRSKTTPTRASTATTNQAATSTHTATPTITGTPTAIAVGQDVATRGTASSSVGSESAQNAIDGDVETTWQSGASGVQRIVIDLDDRYQVDAVALVVSQSSPGETSHEVWARGTDGHLVKVGTVTGPTADRQTLPLHFNPAISVDQLVVRTLRSAGNVAWREIRIFEKLPPPLSTPTPTRTHTPAPTPTPTFISEGRNVAPLGSASASSGTESAGQAIDNDTETAWQASGVLDANIEISLDQFYMIEAIALVAAQSLPEGTTHLVLYQDRSDGQHLISHALDGKAMDRQTLAILLNVAVETNKITVRTSLDSSGTVGWREVRIFEEPTPTPEPSDNSGRARDSDAPALAEIGIAGSGVWPNLSKILNDFLRFAAGSTSGASAAPAAQTPIDGSAEYGVRFKLVLEVEPGSGYLSQ